MLSQAAGFAHHLVKLVDLDVLAAVLALAPRQATVRIEFAGFAFILIPRRGRQARPHLSAGTKGTQ